MTRLFRIGLLVSLVCLAMPAFAGDCEEPEPAEMMKAQQQTMAIMGPGPEHELFAKLVGDYTANVEMWMAPDAEPMSSPMTTSNEFALDGRFVVATSKGSMMGMDVESITYYGYDRRHEQYTMVGFDSFGTYYITATGSYDEATKTIDFHGTDEDPIAGITQDYNFHLTFNDDGSHTLTVIFNCPSFGTEEPYKLMSFTATKSDG